MREALLLALVASSFLIALAAYRLGIRRGRVEMLGEIRAELDRSIDEWTKASEAGEMRRTLELPGLHIVRRMFGTMASLL